MPNEQAMPTDSAADADADMVTGLRERFDQDGWCVVERFLDPERLAAVVAETDAALAEPRPTQTRELLECGYWSQWGVFSDHVWGLERRGPALAALQLDRRARGIAAALAGRSVDAVGMSSQVMFAHCGCKQPWHQDHTPGDPELWWINCVYYLTDMRDDNGCLLLQPGTQRSPLERRVPDYGDIPGSVRVHCPAGSAVFFTNGLMHAVDENRTASVRRNLKVNYVPVGCRFDKQHEQRYSRGVRRETGPSRRCRIRRRATGSPEVLA